MTQRGLIAVCVAFVAAGMLFVPRLGIEADEAIVANGIYDHGERLVFVEHSRTPSVPVMLISYLGALKTWFYNGLFLFTPPRPIILRLPMLLFAAGALWLFFELLDRTIGRRAAWIGTLLLATDTSYLLIEHRGLWSGDSSIRVQAGGAGAAGALSPAADPRQDLAWAFFLFGLGLWDKAIFAWVLFGLAVAAVAVFPRDMRKHLSAREHRSGWIGNARGRAAAGDLQHRPAPGDAASPTLTWSQTAAAGTRPRFSNKPWTAMCCSDS